MFEENYTNTQQNSDSQYNFNKEAVLLHIERSEIKKVANKTAISMILLFAVTVLLGASYGLIAILAGVPKQKIIEIISDPAALQVLQIVISTIMFTIPVVIVAKLSGYSISELVPLKKPERRLSVSLFFFGVAFCAFANIAVSFASSIFEGAGVEYSVDYGENPQGFFGFLLVMLSTVAVPALVEEFAFRGVVMGMLKKFGEGFAIIVSSIIFGLIHGNFEQMPFAFLVGLVLGFVRIKSDSLWICCLIHAFNNFISVFFEYAFGSVAVQTQNVIYMFVLMVCLLSGLCGVFVLAKNPEVFSVEKPNLCCTSKQKYTWFFTSPAVIVLIVIYTLQAITFFF